ncbi:MAG: hypothetical protein NTW59_04680 [Candidatus Diapherotrites archaeon]|nr:hypothetical protein [Candidatus Diapherotrites archaeon]
MAEKKTAGGQPRKAGFSPIASTPGQLYKGIKLLGVSGEGGETKLKKRDLPSFVSLCKSMHKSFPSLAGAKAKFSKETGEAVLFLGWDLQPEELAAASKFLLLLAVIIGIVAVALVYLTPLNSIITSFAGAPELVPVYTLLPFVLIGFVALNFFQKYPISVANGEKTRALTYVPEIIGYMIMSMKLVPNLEKAVEFSAEHGRGKIAEDFKRLIWDVQLGVYNTLSEALDALAYRWGRYSGEFKQALMKIRASVLENTESKRYLLLDSTMVSILESIKNKMEQYARDLSQPSVLLFYLGVLLPLILIIVLPVGSAFSGQAMATPVMLIAIYNIIIPLVTFLFARDVISKRPPTQDVPVIPDNYPGLPRKYTAVLGKTTIDLRLLVVLIAVAGIMGSVFLSAQGLPPSFMVGEKGPQLLQSDKSLAAVLGKEGKPANWFEDDGPYFQQLSAKFGGTEAARILANDRLAFFTKAENDVTPYLLVFGLLFTVTAGASVFVYYLYIYKRREQLKVMQMESEFKDSLYILASRLGENRPVEEALKHAKNFLPDFEISRSLFGKTVENIELLGMPLETAVFDENYGSMRNIPSKSIWTGMRIMVDSVQLGVNVAARTLISLSLQLSNSEKVNQTLKVLVSDTTGMMRTMAVFIAPVVLGITTALQKVVMLTLTTIYNSNMNQTLEALSSAGSVGAMPFNVSSITSGGFGDLNIESLQSMVTPLEFLLIVGIYIIELVVIIVFFTTKIEEDNKLLFAVNLAKSLPIAVAVFLASVIASGVVVGGFFG